jgi:DNA-binding transcriptional LysR family regulator
LNKKEAAVSARQVLSLDALRALDAIDRKGSFAAAAESLHKVPSALSYTIARLEADLNVQLFDRSRQKALLTPAGQFLLQQGRQLLFASHQLEEAVRQLDTGWEQHLRIAVDSIVPLAPLLSCIERFHQLGRLTQLHLTEQVMAGSWDALQSGRVDLAIGLSGEAVSGPFELFPMAEAEFVFAVAAHHALAQLDRPISVADLAGQTAVIVSDSALDLPSRSSGLFDSRQQLFVANMHAKIAAQVAGVGVGFLPRHLIQRQIADGSLLVKQCELPRPHVPLFIGRRRQSNSGQALQWFTEQIVQLDWEKVLAEPVS